MMYNLFSPERAHTRPSRFADKRRAHQSAQRRGQNEVMSFSVDFLPGWSDERGSTAPVYVADRRKRTNTYHSVPLQQPVGDFDTARIRPVSAQGMRASTAVLLLVIMLFTLGVTWLTYRSRMIEVGKGINSDVVRTAQLQQQAADMERQIAQSTTDISIAEMARDMGMRSSKGVDVVYLTAPENAVCVPANDGNFTGTYLATILGD